MKRTTVETAKQILKLATDKTETAYISFLTGASAATINRVINGAVLITQGKHEEARKYYAKEGSKSMYLTVCAALEATPNYESATPVKPESPAEDSKVISLLMEQNNLLREQTELLKELLEVWGK